MIGRRIARRFVVERRLGEGGMGVVYEARDEQRGELVALKTIERVDGDAVYALKREFRSLADLVHPRLVRLHELFSDDGLWFFTMARVRGVPFDAHVRGHERFESDEVSPTATTLEPWPEARVALVRRAFAQLVEGVRVIHDAGKIHLDLKPSNVLVDANGDVVILDFGLVQSSVAVQRTLDGIAGTPVYMAPEQLREGEACAASDWYAVGTMLFEVLTGRWPFGSEMSSMILAKSTGQAAPLARTLNPAAPADLAKLANDLLRPRPEDRPTANEIAAVFGQVQSAPTAPVSVRAPFVGRAAELERLRAAFSEVSSKGARVVYVAGLSGIGKSTLVERFVDSVGDEAIVLRGRCYERESVPFKALDPIVDALSRYLRALPPLVAARAMPRDAPELGKLFPVLARVGVFSQAMEARAVTPDPQELRRRGFGALRELLARLGDTKPVIVALDDLQWGDLDSGTFFTQLLDVDDPPRLLFVGSYRADEVERSALLRNLREHAQRDGVETLALGALDDAESNELASILLAERGDLAATVASESGGSPLFIAELARAREAGATSLNAVIGARVAALSEAARSLLEVVAVAGRPIAQRVALRAAEVSAADDAMALLRAGMLLRSSGAHLEDAVETYHDRIRESVVAALSSDTRTARHLALARVYEAEAEPPVEALAHHYREGAERAKAHDYAVRAAERATDVLAFERAAAFYRDAISLATGQDATSTRDLRVKLADALANAGYGMQAADAYLEAAKSAHGDERIDYERRAAHEILRHGHVDRGMPLLSKISASLDLWSPSSSIALIVAFALTYWYVWRGIDLPQDDARAQRYALVRCDVQSSFSGALANIDFARSAFLAFIALRRAVAAGDRRRAAVAIFGACWIGTLLRPSAGKRIDEWIAYQHRVAKELDLPALAGNGQLCRAVQHYLRGEWKLALDASLAAEATFERCRETANQLHYSRIYALNSLLFLGEFEKERELVQKMRETAHDRENAFSSAIIIRSFCRTRLFYDAPESALEEAHRVLEPFRRMPFSALHINNMSARVNALMYLGRCEEAVHDVEACWPSIKKAGILFSPYVSGLLHYVRGAAAAAAADEVDRPVLKERYASLARKCARVTLATRIEGFKGLAHGIEAGVAFVLGDRTRAIASLELAEAAFDDQKMTHHALIARVQRLRVTGARDEAASLIEEIRALGAVRPERLLLCYVPGFTRA